MSWVFPVVGVTEWSRGSWMTGGTKSHRGRSHEAIDIYAARNSIIVSPVGGTVKASGSSSIGGNWVQIQGDDGNVYYFAHMERPTGLTKGSKVAGGGMIGQVGTSGSAKRTKPHVHFSVKHNGIVINPVKMLQGGITVPVVDRNPEGSTPSGDPVDWNTVLNRGTPGAESDQYTEGPSTVQQLVDYRRENAAEQPDAPKQKASRLIQNSLRGMSNMVSRYGFQTKGAGPTGIAEIDREEMPR